MISTCSSVKPKESPWPWATKEDLDGLRADINARLSNLEKVQATAIVLMIFVMPFIQVFTTNLLGK